ncbi:MAG: serine/threonine-protein kinase [Myxococcota bacterium]
MTSRPVDKPHTPQLWPEPTRPGRVVAATRTVNDGAPTEGPTDDISVEIGLNIGRYVVLRTLGSGGMGTVLAAFDPELDRRVAIKLVPAQREGTQLGPAGQLLLREAKSLAQLGHPNVVAVHDAGTHGAHVFLVMEHVEGVDLRTWCLQPRSPNAILDACVAAGHGLVAAHAAGIVHRDVKPDNILVANDGRIRIADFGLARGDETTDDGVERFAARFGTPGYLAPELAEDPHGAAADQYAWCVSAIELLTGQRPSAADARSPSLFVRGVPPAVMWTLARGLQADPAQRHPSMAALLDALGRARRRRRNILVGLGVATVLGMGAVVGTGEPSPCAETREQLHEHWEQRRNDVAAAFERASSPVAATAWQRLELDLDDYADRWRTQRGMACERALDQGSRPSASAVRRAACLDQRRDAMAAWVDVLASADDDVVHRVALAELPLPSLEACENTETLDRLPPSPRDPILGAQVIALRGELAQASAARHAGQFETAGARLEHVTEQAQALEYAPLSAELELERGRLHRAMHQPEAVRAALEEAIILAERGEDFPARAESWIELTEHYGEDLKEFDHAEVASAAARASLEPLGNPPELRARLELARAEALLNDNRFEPACRIYEQMLADPIPSVPEDLLAHHLGDCLSAINQWDEADEAFARALRLREERFGPMHPLVAETLRMHSLPLMHRARFDEAEAALRRAIAIKEQNFGPESFPVARSLSVLGAVVGNSGKNEAALEILLRAASIVRNAESVVEYDAAPILSNLGSIHSRLGQHDEAQDALFEALDLLDRAVGPNHSRNALVTINLGYARARAGDLRGSARWLERSADLLTGIPSRRLQRAQLLRDAAMNLYPQDPGAALHLASEAVEIGDRYGFQTGTRLWILEHYVGPLREPWP